MDIRRLTFVFGYDEPSYTARYETNYSNFYYSWELSFGVANIDISNETEREVEQNSGKSINIPFAFAAGLKVDVGYAFQRRVKFLRGSGFSFFAGYRANIQGLKAGQDLDGEEDSKIEDDELALEFERLDIWHGPFATASLIF